MSIFENTKREHLNNLLILCRPYFNVLVDLDNLINSSLEVIKLHKNKNSTINLKDNVVKRLESKWYNSLTTGHPDYSVYDDPLYIADIWACWVCYSRNSVKALENPTSLINRSVKDEVTDSGGLILDLGCGFGYTTLALSELFPNSSVYGTNLETSYQYLVAKEVTKHNKRIEILPSFESLKNVKMAFASEYFEHLDRPIEHLYKIIQTCSPRYFIIANGFNGIAIGHFRYYKHLNNVYDAKTMSKNFLSALKMLGYYKMNSKIWNSRPSVWKKIR